MTDFLRRARRLTAVLVIWCATVTTWVIWRVFGDNPPEISAGTTAALGIVFGLPPLIMGLYQWARKTRDDKSTDR